MVNAKLENVQIPVPYLERPGDGEELYNYAYKPPEGVPMSNGKPVEHNFTVTDIRSVRSQNPFTLGKHGFKLVNFPAGRGISDWTDEIQVICSVDRVPLHVQSFRPRSLAQPSAPSQDMYICSYDDKASLQRF